jgi:CBS domain-containing protein
MTTGDLLDLLSRQPPYDRLPETVRRDVAGRVERMSLVPKENVYRYGEVLAGLYLILDGKISVRDQAGNVVSLLQPGNSFGERGLLRDGRAATTAEAASEADILRVPTGLFHDLWEKQPEFRRFFERGRPAEAEDRPSDLATVRVEALMAPNPVTCTPGTSVAEAARTMRDRHISCLAVVEDGALRGLVTLRDLVGRVLAADGDPSGPVGDVMTPAPRTLSPTDIGSDVLHLMAEHRLGHLPILASGKLVGIVTQTDLTRFQSATSAGLIAEAAAASTVGELAAVTARIPRMLMQLVGGGHRHDVVTRMITDVADVVTRRLILLAEDEFGRPPARYVWMACGSQGRQEQTGVSDQDNCIIHEDDLDERDRAYFERLARFVTEGLDACGYVLCPGDMMATNPRWCQPISVWREYFAHWIANPSKEAQMLASVMFDLRPVGGDETLFDGLRRETLRRAAANSIFTAHMASNALTHGTPLGLLRGFATIRAGENRNTIDMKLTGVVPVVDLGRMYALQGRLEAVNTRARLEEALAAGIVSPGGGRDLMDAYDLVADTRLRHQAGQIGRGAPPDNFLPPARLSDFERSHLRDAFVVIKTMQSALMQGRGVLG